MSIFDEEEQMMRAEAAQARVDEFNALPPTEQQSRLRRRPTPDRDAVRATRLHETDGIHDMLLDLENQVIALLPPEHQERFRASQ